MIEDAKHQETKHLLFLFLLTMACCLAASSAPAADFALMVSSSNLACRACTSRQFFSPCATYVVNGSVLAMAIMVNGSDVGGVGDKGMTPTQDALSN